MFGLVIATRHVYSSVDVKIYSFLQIALNND